MKYQQIIIINAQFLKKYLISQYLYKTQMSFYRSETIKHYKLILPRDNAEQIMHSLGQQNLIHIVPLNAPLLDRPYVHQVKRCSQCLMKIRQIELILSQKNILVKREQFTNKQYEAFFNDWNSDYQQNKLNSINILDRIDMAIDQIYQIYKDSSKRIEQLKNKIQFLRENMAIIKAGMIKFGDSFLTDSVNRFDQINLQFSLHDMGSSKINMKAGVVKIKDEMILKRTIFRISRNNSFVFFVPYSDIFQKLEQKQQNKLVFFVLFSSPKGGVLDKKLDKFISTFSPQNYFIPQNINQLSKYQKNLQEQLQQNEKLLALTGTQFSQYLASIATFLPQQTFSRIQSYKMYFLKQKQIYNQLNQMQVYQNFLQASIYVRRNDILVLHKCLKQIQKKYNYLSGQLIQARQQNPPTYFIRNSYTCSAQQIVQTYGVARYKQANPSFFTTITFPFLFGVMFGDIAHGSLMFIFGLSLIFKKEYFQNNLFKMLIPHRYLITLMGFFSLYCGFIYNDFMSISLDIFGSCYNVTSAIPGQPIQRKSLQCVYAVGIDPVWSIAQNSINYVDSLKMKISVIIGVLHMILGIFVKGSNSLYFKKKLDFCFQFLPQLIFMIVLFGYMDFLIIFKWLKPWQLYDPTAPSIITTMINIPLRLGQTEDCCGGQPLWGVPGETSQNSVQLFLLVIAVICVPLMLLPKPLIQIYGKKQASRDLEDVQDNTEQKQILNSQINMQHQDNSQIFVHQLIQTIQYVLGSISNTASYLRLWALSLAHSQLSEVFFQKTVQGGIQKGFIGIPIMIFGYPVLAGATLGVLLCMDSMQCFLHTLRLHWVQFQNKFYKGDGHPFIIFNFKTKVNIELKQN